MTAVLGVLVDKLEIGDNLNIFFLIFTLKISTVIFIVFHQNN